MSSATKTCANLACRVALDSKCVEGYALEECPHINKISVEEIEEVDEPAIIREAERALALSSGEALDRAQASVLQRSHVSRVLGIIGPHDSGKTSLVASVYDLLQEGPVAGIGFAGSSTLIGFEKICHNARAASRRDAPHTERTSVGVEATFFHLDLRPTGGEVTSLFIGDRSGEDYLGATDELARANEFFELRRADAVTLLVNGEQLAASEHRHEVKAITPQIVDALTEAGALRENCRLAVVLTKQDCVLASNHADRVLREFNAIVDAIAERYSNHLGEIGRFIVAASPQNADKVKRGEGVDRLILFWLSATMPSAAVLCPMSQANRRMIDLLDQKGEVRT